jgi:hypothetical protein
VLIKDFEIRRQIRAGEHMLLAPLNGHSAASGSHTVDHPRAIQWLDKEQIGFVLVNKEQYDSDLRRYLQGHEQDYRVIFHRPESKELLVQRLQNGAVGELATPGSRTLK